MRKILFSTLAMVSSIGMSAQTQHNEAPPADTHSVTTNSFWDNWFVQGGIQWSAFYSDEEFGTGLTKSPFKSFRSNPQVSVAVGKWFTPGIGLRTKVSGIWGKSVTDDDDKGNGMKFWNAQEQIMFNISNMITGYNPHRFYSFIPFVGAGLARNCSENIYAMGLSAGLINQMRISNRVAMNVELGWNIMESKFDGTKSKVGKSMYKNFDNNLYAEVGVTFNIGRTRWKKSPDMNAVAALHKSQLDALNAVLAERNAENERLGRELAEARSVKQPEEKCHIVNKVKASPLSIFFAIGSSEIADNENIVNLKSLADFSKNNNARLMVTGYADNGTGTDEFNARLSEQRASAVADRLAEMGVRRSNIKVVANGGVDTLTPHSYNRRVIVEIAD